MKVEFYKAVWGFEDDFASGIFLGRAREAGYSGFECPIGFDPGVAADSGLAYVAQAFPESVDQMARDLDQALRYSPKMVNLQIGKDHWDETRSAEFLEGALRLVAHFPIPVVFETHRGRICYSAASTACWLKRYPDIRLCADFSHWTCVSESLLADQEEAVSLAISHADYIHARIGHQLGPQVSDPRHERWQVQTDVFVGWWRRWLESKRQEGWPSAGINPEFGPPNYMPTDSEDYKEDLWEHCAYVKGILSRL